MEEIYEKVKEYQKTWNEPELNSVYTRRVHFSANEFKEVLANASKKPSERKPDNFVSKIVFMLDSMGIPLDKKKTKEQFLFAISSFIEEAIAKYNDFNKSLPSGIIIYRQGVSFQQKEFLEKEVSNIQKVCDKNKILYDYILVNTKTTYKFFESQKGGYANPEGGLLVLDGVTNRN